MRDSDPAFYDIDEFRLDLSKEKLLRNGEAVSLSHKAFQTLQILVQNAGHVVEKEYLYNALWADSFVEESNLTQYIYLLRKIFATDATGASYIETVARRGYIFTGQVETVFASEPPTNGTPKSAPSQNGFKLSRIVTTDKPYEIDQRDISPNAGAENEENRIEQDIDDPVVFTDPSPVGAKKRRWAVILLSVGILAAIAVLILILRTDATGPIGNVAAVKSIAVLPFQPIGDESRDTKLGFGMADAIITRLTNLQQIPVRPTSAVFRYIDSPAMDYAVAGRELGVESILQGTVQKDGDRVRVSVQLFNVADGNPIWAEKFDEKYTDVFSLQDSIASRVVRSLALKLTPQQQKSLERRITSNPEALDAYQMGVYFWNTRTKENLQKAEVSFLKAIDFDPNFATAYAMLADTYNMQNYYGYVDPADRMATRAKAKTAVAKALELDDAVAEAHIANAFLQFTPTGVDSAKTSIERAIQLAPYNSTARLRYAWILLRLDKVDDALNEMKLAREYDPLSATSNGALCSMLIYKESFAEAVDVCRKSVELGPQTANNRLALANALFFNGNTTEAIAQAQRDVDEDKQKFSALGNIGYYYAKLGRRAEAAAILNQLEPQVNKEPMLLADMTLIHYALGNRERSFSYFKQAYEKSILSVSGFHYDPVWKEIRSDTQFADVMKKDSAS
ncbi:MAG: winged helix-turn-helix domain-containing protein [Acidobacteriota bacterium]